mgnify:FL=1
MNTRVDNTKARTAQGDVDGRACELASADCAGWAPPLSNRGGAETAGLNEAERFEHYSTTLMDSQGRLLEIPLRRGVANSAFIDQISFSVHEDTFSVIAGYPLVADDEYIIRASMILNDIFGFGISERAKHSGGRFYESCWLMGTDNAQYGRVHFGGQNNTMLFELTATGCNAASDGWEGRLHDFIAGAVRPKITRIDIAKDFFEREYSPEQAAVDRLEGKYTNHHMMPDGEKAGSDWESNNGKGKTYYVGSRESSKFVRIYEKGKQLGDKSSDWVRFEIEFKSKDIVIPFDVLLYPGEYFGGAYPICRQFQQKAVRIEAVRKNLELTFERGLEVAKNQVGRMINAVISMFPEKNDSEILAMFKPAHDLLPKRLSPEVYSAEYNSAPAVHDELEDRITLGESTRMLVEMSLEAKRKLNDYFEKKAEEDYLNWAYDTYCQRF